MTKNQNRPRIFISYSREDKRWADRLRVHLRAVGDIEVWQDSAIKPGSDWKEAIRIAETINQVVRKPVVAKEKEEISVSLVEEIAKKVIDLLGSERKPYLRAKPPQNLRRRQYKVIWCLS